MKKIKFTTLIIASLAAGVYNPVRAQKNLNVATTAVPFLRIMPDARSGGMANAGIATGGGAYSIFHNMAATVFEHNAAAVSVGYTPWMASEGSDSYLASVNGYKQLDENKALSGGLRYFNMGSVSLSDDQGASLGNAMPRELGLDLGYAMKLGNKLSLGLTVRYVHSKLVSGSINGTDYKAGNAFGADISLFHNGLDSRGAGFTWGAVLSNLGSRISYSSNAGRKDFIPANLGIGAAYTAAPDDQNRIKFSVDVNKLLVPVLPGDSLGIVDYYSKSVTSSWFKSFGGDGGGVKSLQYSLAAEYGFDERFFLRAGYYYQAKSTGGQPAFTVGAGFRYSIADIDISYLAPSGGGLDRNPLSNTVRVSLSFAIGKK
ncbi:MAG: type IX secretion system outer membrane channel protein PorV [Bacteroidetes bacterium]|nr:type IX secretion system outer membrane channel protein PorV [Bacteroidota bacterium]